MSRANDGTEKRGKDKARESRLRKEKRGSGQIPLGYTDLSSGTIDRLVLVVTACGGAVQFGLTRDYGAAMLKLYYHGESETIYYRPSDDIQSEIEEWIEHFTKIWTEEDDPTKLPPPDLADATLRRLGV